MEIQEARLHLAKKLKDDVGWWYNQAKRIVEYPSGRQDDNAAKVVLAVLDKLLPSLKEVIRDESASAPPVAITITGLNRGVTARSDEVIEVAVEKADAPAG